MSDFVEEKNHNVKNKKNEILDDIQTEEIEEEFGIDLEDRSPEEIAYLVKMETKMEECFSGPIPHPRILKGYEEILPGSADRILKMAENQSKHRQEIEIEVVHSNTKNSLLGVWFGFVLGAIGLIGGIIAAILGAEIVGSIISTTSLAALVGVFVYGTRSEKKERIEKND